MTATLLLSPGLYPEEFLRPTVNYIASVQEADGRIPWFEGQHTDPWNHAEAAMGLSIGGEYDAAERAYQWLADSQLDDGSWWAAYGGKKTDAHDRKETNFVGYVAVAIWHHFKITGKREFLEQHWPMIQKAADYICQQQTEYGDVYWAIEADGSPMDDSLLTGCSSLCKSMECAVNIGVTLEQEDQQQRWDNARSALVNTVKNHPERFDRHWESKARYAMDWFYPVLGGALTGQAARQHIAKRWDEFVVPELGCHCVTDQPWVAVAETCELVMALLACDQHAQAVKLFSHLHRFQHSNGGYWTGYVYKDEAIWPEELTTWTAGAILLAADALTEHTPAHGIFQPGNALPIQADVKPVLKTS